MTHVSFGSQCGGEPGGASESSDFVWGRAPCATAAVGYSAIAASTARTHLMGASLLAQPVAERAGVGEQRRLQRLVVHRGRRVVEREELPAARGEHRPVHLADLGARREVL